MKYKKKEIADFPGYFVDTEGNIFDSKGREKASHVYNGAYRTNLVFDGKKYIRNISKIVYKTFIGEIPGGYNITYKDGDNTNLSADNLDIVRPAQGRRKFSDEQIREIFYLRSQRYSIEEIREITGFSRVSEVLQRKIYGHVQIDPEIEKAAKSVVNIRSVITMEKATEIREKRSRGYSLKQLKEEYGISYTAISFIINNKTWKR